MATIDCEGRVVYVQPTQESGRPFWLGQVQALSYELCQSILALLTSEAHLLLPRRGADVLAAARDERRFLRTAPHS